MRVRRPIGTFYLLAYFTTRTSTNRPPFVRWGGSGGFPQSLFGFGNILHVHKVHVYEVYAHEVHAYELHAHEVQAYEVHTHKVQAREMHAHEVHACEIHV